MAPGGLREEAAQLVMRKAFEAAHDMLSDAIEMKLPGIPFFECLSPVNKYSHSCLNFMAIAISSISPVFQCVFPWQKNLDFFLFF